MERESSEQESRWRWAGRGAEDREGAERRPGPGRDPTGRAGLGWDGREKRPGKAPSEAECEPRAQEHRGKEELGVCLPRLCVSDQQCYELSAL